MSTPAPTDPIRTATEAVLRTAVAFDAIDNSSDHGTHSKATAYAEFMHALMGYHMAELALIRGADATGPQRPMLLEAAEAPTRTLNAGECALIMAALDDYAGSLDHQALDEMQGPHRRHLEREAERSRELSELVAECTVRTARP